MNARRGAALVLFVGGVAVIAHQAWITFAPLPEADACAAAVRAARMRSTGDDRAASVAKACGPLFREASCREAHAQFETDAPARRARRLAERCRDAYCPSLPEPKPSLCTAALDNPPEMAKAWGTFVTTVLEMEHGRRVKPALEAFRAKD